MQCTSIPRRARFAIATGFFSLGLIGGAQARAAEATINGLSPRAYIESLFAAFFTAPTLPPAEAVKAFLWPDAVNYADGKPVTVADQVAHLEYLHKNATMTFDLQQVTYDGAWLAERHLGHTVLKDGKTIDSEIAVFFHIRDGKIDGSFEITRPMSGIDADRDIHTVK
jgi:ketosteroid isomerase-like protein